MPTARDGCVVPSEPLAALVRTFVTDWGRTRPATGGQFGQRRTRAPGVTMGAVEWLAERTRQYDPGGIGVPATTIEMFTRKTGPRYRLTELRIADPLVAAIGKPTAFHDGTLTIQANPLATLSAQRECCGGSLTGSAAAASRLADYASARPAVGRARTARRR